MREAIVLMGVEVHGEDAGLLRSATETLQNALRRTISRRRDSGRGQITTGDQPASPSGAEL